MNSHFYVSFLQIHSYLTGVFFVMMFFYHLNLQNYTGEEELFCVYVPTNHLYIGDVFMINSRDVIRPNLSVREGIG